MTIICKKMRVFQQIFDKEILKYIRYKSVISASIFHVKCSNLHYLQTLHKGPQRKYSQKYFIKASNIEEEELTTSTNPAVGQAIEYEKDSKIIYSSYNEGCKVHVSYFEKKRLVSSTIKEETESRIAASISLALGKKFRPLNHKIQPIVPEKYLKPSVETHTKESRFPLAQVHDIDAVFEKHESQNDVIWDDESAIKDSGRISQTEIKEDIDRRLSSYYQRKRKKELFESSSLYKVDSKSSSTSNDMPDIYGDSFLTDLSNSDPENAIKLPKYGTPDSSIKVSKVPCGGCGAILHCQNQGLPGYMPSEIFRNKTKAQLQREICQRCFYLTHYDMAINIKVSPDVYEKALEPIRNDMAAAIVMLDIIDVPCSIWPGLYDLLGSKRPVFVVGNKVDLLPPDRIDPMEAIKKSFVGAIRKSCLWKTNIVHIAVTSAVTGYGIEHLITRIQEAWGTKGNIYIIGCTNAGKSTIFNALAGSDMCQVQALDIAQRATSSPWPGTTLNLLKFPLMKPTGGRLYRRMARLALQEHQNVEDEETPKGTLTNDYTAATLTGYIGQTFKYDTSFPEENSESFRIKGNITRLSQMQIPRKGIPDKDYNFRDCKWLYDTPGTLQPDQILGLLTHEELLKVLPKSVIEPRTFSLRSGHSLFLGGLGRVDLLYAEDVAIRLTVFASKELPVTITRTVDATSVYRQYLGGDLFGVPSGSESRMQRWPGLKPANIKLLNKEFKGVSCCDITLSSAGFVTVTGTEAKEIDLRIWTPGSRGIYVRSPSMLPLAVQLRGNRIRGTPAFLPHKVYIPDMETKIN